MDKDVDRKVAQALGFNPDVNDFAMSTRAYTRAAEILGPIIVLSEEIQSGTAYNGNLRGGAEVLRRKIARARTDWDNYLERYGGEEMYEDRVAHEMSSALSRADAQLRVLQRRLERETRGTIPASYRL